MKQAKQIFRDALLLTFTSLLIRTVGVWFQIYISARAGAEVMGLYALMSGVYGFALTLATSGIHLGVTRVVAEMLSRKQEEKIPSLVRRAILYALFFGLLSAFLLFTFAEPISLRWLKDSRTVTSLRFLSVTLPLISLTSVFGGYFTAVRRSTKSAIGQISEQGLRIFICMYLLSLPFANTAERLLNALVIGGALSEILSFLLEFILFRLDKRHHFPSKKLESASLEEMQLLRITLPVALTTYVRSGLLTLEHILIPEGLRNSGASHSAALAAYGSIQSMALPIILYPAALIGAFSGLLIPAVAECYVSGSEKRLMYMISRVWHLSTIFSIGVAGILICFSTELGNALYPGTETAAYIRLLAPLIPIMYVDTATDAILKGIGQQLYSMVINIVDAGLSVLLVLILVPHFGIAGYLITVYISETFNTVLSVTRLLVISKTRVHPLKWVYLPLLSIVGATCFAHFLFSRLPHLPSGKWDIALHCTITALVYLLLLFFSGSLGREERAWIRTLFNFPRSKTTAGVVSPPERRKAFRERV